MAAARRLRPEAAAVSFGWREYVGEREEVALGEEGLLCEVADASYRLASDLAQAWHTVGERRFLEVEGVPVGAAAQADLFHFFEPNLRLAFILDHILETHRPSRLVFADDGSDRPALLASLLRGRGVPFDVVGRGGGRGRQRLGLAARRILWPAMFAAARRRARAAGGRPGAGKRGRESAGTVFWGQFGRFELDVYRGLRAAYGDDLPYFASTLAAARAARSGGLACESLLDRLPPRRRTQQIFKALAASYRELERAAWLEEYDLPPGLAAFYREHFPFRPQAYLITLAMFAAAVERYLARRPPRLLLHLSDVHMTGRLAAELASREGIPTLVIQNHITGGPTFGYLPLSSTKMAAWGRVSYEWLVAGGASPKKLVVVGSPYAAAATAQYGKARGEIGDSLVVATNLADPEQNRLVALACAAYARERGRRLLFRPHPVEPAGMYRKIVEYAGVPDARVAAEEPLADVLAGAAVVVAAHSGVGVDALLAGVPLVHVNLMAGIPDYLPYVEYGAALGVSRLADLPAAIEEAWAAPPGRFDAGREAWAREYLGAEAGDPFENIVALARELEARR
ncbi:MAG: hypothetical protein JSU81_07810 [Candidatus Coatesbacteria bacterium]|nr:MAG: hypothetical protein JSU81_07810 [Candidatus Coatesbacteria bacterium]